MQNQPTSNKTVSCKWTATLFLAFCFLLYAQDSKSKNSQQVDSEINVEMTSEQKISDRQERMIKVR